MHGCTRMGKLASPSARFDRHLPTRRLVRELRRYWSEMKRCLQSLRTIEGDEQEFDQRAKRDASLTSEGVVLCQFLSGGGELCALRFSNLRVSKI